MPRENKTPLTDEQRQLVEENLQLVGWVLVNTGQSLMKYFRNDDDARQVGCVGLIRAARGWDAQRGVKFSTYALRSIRNELIRQAPCQRGIRHPKYAAKRLGFCTPTLGGDELSEGIRQPDEDDRWDLVQRREQLLAEFVERDTPEAVLLRMVMAQATRAEIAAVFRVKKYLVPELKAALFAELRRLEAAA